MTLRLDRGWEDESSNHRSQCPDTLRFPLANPIVACLLTSMQYADLCYLPCLEEPPFPVCDKSGR